MSKRTKRINVTFSPESYEHIERLAAQRNQSMSEVVRLYAEDGLAGQLNKDNIDFIAYIIRDQVRAVITPAVERLASLSAKTCIEATTSTYLTAETISKFVPEELQESLVEVYEKARKKALADMRNKNTKDGD